jgi:hypothetical protein
LDIPIKRITKKNSIYEILKSIKREPVGVGRYPEVSLIENLHRIFSDLVVLFGIRRLLFDLSDEYDFEEYRVNLGTEKGTDINAEKNGTTLAGEAFNVAKSYFQSKKSTILKTLLSRKAEYKILMFNSDAVNNPNKYDRIKNKRGFTNLVVDVDQGLKMLGLF